MSAPSQTSSQSLKSLLNRLKLILSQSSSTSPFNNSNYDEDDDPDEQNNIVSSSSSSQQTDLLSQINAVVKQISSIDSKELTKMLNILSSPLRECISIPGTAKEAITLLQTISDAQPLTYRVPSIDIQLVIAQLCNNDPITRKQAHLFMLATSKKPLNLPTLINAYVTYGFQSQDSLLRQKSVNSYQGLILAQPDAFDSQLNSTYSLLNALLHIWLHDDIQAVQKAADHALVSLCKLDEMRVAVTKLDLDQLEAIKQIAEKHLILGLLPQELENSSIVLQQHKKDRLKNTMNPSNNGSTNNNREIESKLPLKNSDVNMSSQNTNSKLQSVGSSSDNPPEEEITKFGMLTDRQLADLSPLNKDWKSKTSAIEDLESRIETAKDLRSIEKDMRDFMILILSLSSNTNFKIQITAMNILSAVINLRACIQPANLALLSNSLPEKLGDTKIAVRQIAAKIIQQHFQQFREWSWLDELSRQLESRNQQLRGESINVIEKILEIAQGSKMTERLNWKLLLTQLAKGVSEQREPFSAKCFRSVGLMKQLLSDNESFKEHLRIVLPEIIVADRPANLSGSKPAARQIQFEEHNTDDSSAAVAALLQKQQILHQPDAYLKNQRYQPTTNMSDAKNIPTTRFDGDGIFEGTPATAAISSISSRKLSSSTSKPNSFLPSSLLSDNSLPPISMQKKTKTQDRNIFQQQQQQQQQQQTQVPLQQQQQQSSILSMLNSKIAGGNSNKRDNFSMNNTTNRIETQEDVDSSFGNNNKNNNNNNNIPSDAFSGKHNGYLNSNNNTNKGCINVSANSIQLQSTVNPRQINYNSYKYSGNQQQPDCDELVFDENTSKNIHAEDLFRDQAYGNKPSQQALEASSSKALENLKSKRINSQLQQQYSKQPSSQARYPSASSAEERFIVSEMQSSASKPPVNTSKRTIPQASASASNSANNTPSLPPRKRYNPQGDTSIYEDNSNRNSANSNTNKDSLSELTFSSNQNINIMSPPSPFKKTFKSTGLVTADGGNYTQFEDLEKLRNPESVVNGVLSELRSGDWERQFNAMDSIRKIVKFHGEIMVKHSDFGLIMKEVASLVENLRSSVSKNALVTVSELCEGFKKSMDSFIDSLLGALLRKGMDANVFILQSVRMAFECVSRNCSAGKVSLCCLSLLPTAKPANAKQLLILGLSTILQGDLQKIKDLDRIIIALGGLAQDSSQEVRSAAKNVLIESSQRSNVVLNVLNKAYQPAVVAKILTPSGNTTNSGNNQYQSTANSTSNSIFQRSSNSLLQKTNPRGQFGANSGFSNRVIAGSNNNNNNTNNQNGTFNRQESQQDDSDDAYLNFKKTPVMISPISIKLQKNNSQPQQSQGGSSQTSELAPTRTIKSSSLARLQKSNSLSDTLPETLAAADSSDWQNRIGCIGDLEKAAISAPREIINHKSFVRFLDVFVRLNNDSNMKVQTKSLEAFQQLVPLLADSMGNSIQSILNSIFTAASSNNSQIKRKAEETLETIVSSVDSSYLLEPLSNGVLFANPRSKPLILDHLTNICNEVSKKKQQVFQKTITKTIQKLLQENKVELKSSLKKLIQEVYEILEEDMFIGVLAPFKDQIMESVQ